MKKCTLLMLCLFAGLSFASAQDTAEKFKKNIYVEWLGNGILVSANYDMRIKKGVPDGLGFRIGMGGGNLEAETVQGDRLDLSMLTIPMGLNYLVGRRRSFFEAGLGVTPAYINAREIYVDNEFFSGKGWGVVGVMNIGYRFQPIRRGIMFRLDWTPVFGKEGFYGRFFGFSLGIGFK